MADHGFDSDEDRVTFDDDVQTVNSATKSMSSSKRGKKTHFDVPKQKSLFQYKRFRGNLDNDDFGTDFPPADMTDHSLLDIAPDVDLNSIEPHVRSPGKSLISVEPTANDSATTFSSSRPSSSEIQSRRVHIVSTIAEDCITAKSVNDVALDRPDHWKSSFRTKLQPNNANNKRKLQSNSSSSHVVPSSTQVVPRTKTAVVNKNLLKTAATNPGSRANVLSNLQSVSFHPSWMNATNFNNNDLIVGRVPPNYLNNDRRQSSNEPIVVEDEIIADDERNVRQRRGNISTTRGQFPNQANNNNNMGNMNNIRQQVSSVSCDNTNYNNNNNNQYEQSDNNHHNNEYDNNNDNNEGYEDHQQQQQQQIVVQSPQRILPHLSQIAFTSPPPAQYIRSFGSSTHNTNNNNSNNSHYKHHNTTSKAKPGSLKARLQKILRDNDGQENRMINIPRSEVLHLDSLLQQGGVQGGGVVVDLQDPRGRASSFFDIEVVSLRSQQSVRSTDTSTVGTSTTAPQYEPFIVSRVLILHVWTKPTVNNNSSGGCGVMRRLEDSFQAVVGDGQLNNNNTNINNNSVGVSDQPHVNMPQSINTTTITSNNDYQTPHRYTTTSTSLRSSLHHQHIPQDTLDTFVVNDNDISGFGVGYELQRLDDSALQGSSGVINDSVGVSGSGETLTPPQLDSGPNSEIRGAYGPQNANGNDHDAYLSSRVGTYCYAYFKPSTCMGSERHLREGLSLRVYNPVLISSSSSASEKRGGVRGSVDEEEQEEEEPTMVCTHIWEPIMSGGSGDGGRGRRGNGYEY